MWLAVPGPEQERLAPVVQFGRLRQPGSRSTALRASTGRIDSMTGAGRQSFTRGLRLGIGPGLATGVLALNFGAEARARGWGTVAPVAFSALAFSGSAQFTLLSSL